MKVITTVVGSLQTNCYLLIDEETKLAALDGVIPQLKKSEVARNIGKDNYDAVLVSEFESMDDLNAYKVDPRHVAVSDICKSIRADRVAVDYEM
jgi:hypothetical protein